MAGQLVIAMEKLLDRIEKLGLLPVIKIENAADAVPLARALKEGGLPAAEITFRTDAAEEAIRAIAEAFPEFLIVAGTVLTEEQADRAIAAGASLIVAPGFDPELVRYCQKKGYPIVPGVCTPSEIAVALRMGLSHLKFFPAEASGGVKMIKALAAPYGMIRFMPTGGVSLENLGAYLGEKAVFSCGGSWLAPAKDIREGCFDEICKRTAAAVALVKEIRA